MKIFDCTLRDGGYYTNWDFNHKIVEQYLKIMSQLPIDYVEVGYRSVKQPVYRGEFYFLPVATLSRCRELCPNKKLSVMLNLKEINLNNIEGLLHSCFGLVDMIRLAIRPEDVNFAEYIVPIIQAMGFEVGCNIMYMSTWNTIQGFYESCIELGKKADYIWMVDSYGGMLPAKMYDTIKNIKKYIHCPLGFHGHNNMELSFANSIVALEEGVECIDSTVLGMGRGAGNLKTELLLTYLSSKKKDVPFHLLQELVELFTPMQQKYLFGINLPYMISGTYSLPQKDIMEWMSKRRYSVSSIVQTLQARTHKLEMRVLQQICLPRYKTPLVIGGGESIVQHLDAINQFIATYADSMVLIFTSCKYLSLFNFVPNAIRRCICLVGSEGLRLERYRDFVRQEDICVVNPQAQTHSTYIPEFVQNRTYSLPTLTISENMKQYVDSPLFVAMALCNTQARTYLIGFDGYDENVKDGAYDLMHENQVILDNYDGDIISLLPSKYENISQQSIYALI